MSTDEDGEVFWLSEGQADVLAREYGATASPLYLNGTAQMLVEGFQKFGRLQARMLASAIALRVQPCVSPLILCPIPGAPMS